MKLLLEHEALAHQDNEGKASLKYTHHYEAEPLSAEAELISAAIKPCGS